MIQTFIRDLQASSQNRKSRWLLGSTVLLGLMVVSLWSAYFPMVLRGEQLDYYVEQKEQIIGQDDFSVWRSTRESAALIGDNISSIWKQVGKWWTVETVVVPD